MAHNTVPPFFQLGRRIVFQVWHGDHSEEFAGEVVDTDVGWIAVQTKSDGVARWFNLDFVISIEVVGPLRPA